MKQFEQERLGRMRDEYQNIMKNFDQKKQKIKKTLK